MTPLKRKVIVWISFLDRKGVQRKRAVTRTVSPPKRKPKLRVVGPKRANSKNRHSVTKSKAKTPKMPRGQLRPKGKKTGMLFRFADALGPRTLFRRGDPIPSQNFEILQRVPAQTNNLFGLASTSGAKSVPHPQQYTHEKTSSSFGMQVTIYPGGAIAGGEGYGMVGSTPDSYMPSADTTTAYNNAVSQLYDEIRGKLDLSIDLFERGKTSSMVKSAVKGLTSFATTLRKMKRSNPRDWGNLWLQFTYGWKPLASSIYGSLEALAQPNREGFEYVKARGSTTQSKTGSYVDSNGNDSAYRCDVSCRVEIGAKFSFADSALNRLAGVTSLNPASIAWELTPYSFVVDWFVNVGGYMRSLESSLLYASDFVSGYKTQTVRRTYSFGSTGVKQRNDIPGAIDVWQYGGHFVGTTKQRTVLNDAPLPSLPVFSPSLGWSRAVSGSALLGQNLTSLKHEAQELEIKRPKKR